MDILKLLRQAYRAYRQRKNWQRVVRAMAMVVVFCTTYALILPAITLEQQPGCGLAEHIHDNSCYGEATVHIHTEECCEYLVICGQEEHAAHIHTEACNGVVTVMTCEEDHTHEATCYVYETGIICGLEETQGHAHVDDCHQKNLICGLEEGAQYVPLICGQEEHTHTDACYVATEPTEKPTEEPTEEPTEAPTEPEEKQPHSYADENLQAQVALGTDTTVPADAEVILAALTEEDAQYVELTALLEETVEANILEKTLLDISFFDTQGEYISVADTATVTLQLEGKLFNETVAKVYHFVDGAPIEIENVEVSYLTVAGEEDVQTEYTQLTFQTDGFSVFAIVEAEQNITDRVAITDVDPTQLAGTYYIACPHGTRDIYCAIKNTSGLDYYTGNYGSEWTFTQVSGNTYTIHCGNQYMVMSSSNGYVSLTTDATAASVFTVTQNNGKYNLQVGSYYINEHGGHNNITNFRGYNVAGDSGNNLTLFPAKPKADNLNGKEFVLLSYTQPKAMGNYALTVNGVNGLGTNDVTLSTVDGVTYVKGDVTTWTFTATATSGVYNISTKDTNGNTKYLKMLETYYDTSGDAKGSLTLSDTAQDITVTVNDDGTVYLTYLDANAKTGYVNLDQASYNFWTYNGTGDYSKIRLAVEQTIREEFEVTYNSYTITASLQDSAGNAMMAEMEDQTLTAGQTVTFADIAPEIADYTLYRVLLENGDTDPQILSVTADVSGTLIFNGSGGESYPKDEDSQVYLIYRPAKVTLHYTINSPAVNGWVNNDGDGNYAPSLAATSQDITETVTNLYQLAGRNGAGYFIASTLYHRGTEKNYFDTFNDTNNYKPGDAGYLPPGAEYEFLGWQANNINGESCLFPENAEVYMDEAGNPQITDVNGVVQTVANGTTLQGKWKIRSNAILFYVNHGDTMLEGEDNQPIGSTASEYYTEIAAIGHIYNIDDPDAFVREKIEISTHAAIEDILEPVYDPNSSETQIVVDAVKQYDSNGNASYVEAPNYNEILLEAAIASYIRSQEGKKILLDQAELDKSMITPENYMLYWYGMKLVSSDGNSYHMDGVLVAKTQTMEIYKTFSGLTRDQANTLISQMEFPLHLIHTETDTNGNEVEVKDSYTTLIASSSQQGVYTYDGPQSETGNIFKWTLEAVLGQRYAFEEDKYALTETDANGDTVVYDVSSLVSVHYTDGTVIYHYSADATYEDIDTTTGTINGLFKEKPLVGGNVESIIFANFYTKENTGTFSISKVADAEGKVRLPGAIFTLTDKNDSTKVYTDTTNENGAAEFYDLPVGTYILEETKEPVGYQGVDTKWQVNVTETGDVVTVTIQEILDDDTLGAAKELYNTTEGLKDVYRIQNQPESTTVTINKYFTNIAASEVQSLYDTDAEWEDDYYIQVLDSSNHPVYTLTLDKDSATLTKATAITGAINGYSWTVNLTPNNTYTFVEKNYLQEYYLDTVVAASVNGTEATITKTDTDADSEPDTASFTVNKSEAADMVNITNTYTNTFTLQLHKVDATNGNAGIGGVMFKIYGDFQQSTGSETLEYTDDNGVVHTVYYVATVTTDADGYAKYDGMQLSSGSRSFLYVVDEVETPAGYIQLSEPIVKVIEVDSENYQNGVYTLTIENFEIEKLEELKAMVDVVATKEWDVPSDMDPADYPDVTLSLYRKESNNTATRLHTVTLTGDDVAKTTISGDFAYEVTGWQVEWSGLPYADTGSSTRYEYYVAEAAIPGYNTLYSTYPEKLTVGTTDVYAARAKAGPDTQLNRQITVTNTTRYALPESGGIGVGWHTSLGLSLMIACIWLSWCGIYKKKRGGVDTT